MKNKVIKILLGITLTGVSLAESLTVGSLIGYNLMPNVTSNAVLELTGINLDDSIHTLYGPFVVDNEEDAEEDDFNPSSEDSYTMYGMAQPNNPQN